MKNDGVDKGRRRLLTGLTVGTGAVGAGFVAWPFLASWNPSARAQAAGAPVEIDISKLQYGQQMTVEWRGKPVWIVRRDQKMLESLESLTDNLADPDSAEEGQQPAGMTGPYRAINPEYFVTVGLCTHLGCSPTYVKELGSVSPDWLGGFFCPCHGSKFDLSGRVFKGVPAQRNLEVPPYQFLSDTRILIGAAEGEAA